MAVLRQQAREDKLQGELDDLYKAGALIVAVVPSVLYHKPHGDGLVDVVTYRIYYVPADQR